METVLNKEWNFREQDFKSQVAKIRAQVDSEVDAGCAQVRNGIISESEFDKTTAALVTAGNSAITNVIRDRQAAISEQELAYSRRLAGVQDTDQGTLREFRSAYEDLLERATKDKNTLISHYKQSLRLGDEISLRAAGLAAFELGVREVAADFAERDPDFAETAAEMTRFKRRYHDPEAKLADRLGDFRGIDPPRIKREPFQSGYTLNGNGMQVPHYRNRLYKK